MGEIIRGFPYNSTLPHFQKCAVSVKCRNSGFQGHGWTWLQLQIRVHIRYRPIGGQNGQNLYPFADKNGSKTTPIGAAHTYMAYIRNYPTPREQTIRHSFMNGNHNREFSMLLFQLKGQVLRVFCVLVKIVQKSLPSTSIDTRSCKTGRKISNEFWQGD